MTFFTHLILSNLQQHTQLNMKYFVVALAISTLHAVNGGRLGNTYLPPGSAATAGAAGLIRTPGFSQDYNAQPGRLTGGYYQGNAGQHGQVIAITQYTNQNNGDGSYRYNYETANGISVQEAGAPHGDAQTVTGAFSYTGTDGAQYTVHYTADENGFRPEGAHLPTPPPIPEEIRRGVELSLAAEARGENQDGQYHGSANAQTYSGIQNQYNAHAGYRY
ncbi:endocuticle structural glycoprotein SgAbd-8 [Cephus cinctus]|uniref:Endocuticle structural glycoprotein SgAbd-8 n=1 Tax=Cephus cinctus TaxID=211228 RepID=A0AAJ7R812_CEPCN|nr:endocuticle structural glycoprotein SgAbd-8 [Cephus cinctus]XP_024935773.1 endocuticle structural glycoprotein SgAbd-8 [Cephus cinctus]XP_024935774.1 endocuticle structural glycoprotein SgAbd-8 [Cephus cinctus]